MTLTPGTTAPTAAPPAAPIAASCATRELVAHAPRAAVLASVIARMDCRIAVSPVQLNCMNMHKCRRYRRRRSMLQAQERRPRLIVPQPRQCKRRATRDQRYIHRQPFEFALGIKFGTKATIYHNPMCGTSRKTLEILRDSGLDVWIHAYLKNTATRDALKLLCDRSR